MKKINNPYIIIIIKYICIILTECCITFHLLEFFSSWDKYIFIYILRIAWTTYFVTRNPFPESRKRCSNNQENYKRTGGFG